MSALVKGTTVGGQKDSLADTITNAAVAIMKATATPVSVAQPSQQAPPSVVMSPGKVLS